MRGSDLEFNNSFKPSRGLREMTCAALRALEIRLEIGPKNAPKYCLTLDLPLLSIFENEIVLRDFMA